MSQTTQILKHLKRHTITPIQALHLYGCFRLGGRVWELRKQGYDIRTTLVGSHGKHFARYKLHR